MSEKKYGTSTVIMLIVSLKAVLQKFYKSLKPCSFNKL